MADDLYLCRSFSLVLFRRVAIPCLFIVFTGCKKPGKNNPVWSTACVWSHRFLVVVLLVEKCSGRIGRFYSVPSISLYSFVHFPACQWICNSALPPLTHRLLVAPGNGLFCTDNSRRRGLCPGGQRIEFDLEFDLCHDHPLGQSLFNRHAGFCDCSGSRPCSYSF